MGRRRQQESSVYSSCFVCAADVSRDRERILVNTVSDLPVPIAVWEEFFKGAVPWTPGDKLLCKNCTEKLLEFQTTHDRLLALRSNFLGMITCPPKPTSENKFSGSNAPSDPEQSQVRNPVKARKGDKAEQVYVHSSRAKPCANVTFFQPQSTSVARGRQTSVSSESSRRSGRRRELPRRYSPSGSDVASSSRPLSLFDEKSSLKKKRRVSSKKDKHPSREAPCSLGSLSSGADATSGALDQDEDKEDCLPQLCRETLETQIEFAQERAVPLGVKDEEVEIPVENMAHSATFVSRKDESFPVEDQEEEADEANRRFDEIKIKGEVKLVCRICQEKCPTIEDFNTHYDLVHLRLVPLSLDFPEDDPNDNLFESYMPQALLLSPSQPTARPSIKKAFYPCGIAGCGARLASASKLKQHVTGCHSFSTVTYPCPICKTVFWLYRKFRSHVSEHERKGEAVFRCDICDARFDLYKELQRHRYNKHKDANHYSCRYCEAQFPTSRDRDDHHQSHLLERPFECGECGMRFDDKSTLRVHVNTHTKTLKVSYPCPICEKTFSTRGARRAHETSTHSSCPECGKCNFRVFTSLLKHIRAQHGGKIFKNTCDSCGLGFQYPSALQKHKRRKHGEGASKGPEFQCSACGRLFSESCNLRRHFNLVHSEEKQFACPICQKREGNKYSLARHIERAHEKKKRFFCEYCPKCFTYPQALSRHRRTHQNDRRFVCPYCDKTFITWENRHMHLFVHFKKKMYECKHCGESFMRLKFAKVHLNLQHREVSQEPLNASLVRNKPFKYSGDGKILECNEIVDDSDSIDFEVLEESDVVQGDVHEIYVAENIDDFDLGDTTLVPIVEDCDLDGGFSSTDFVVVGA